MTKWLSRTVDPELLARCNGLLDIPQFLITMAIGRGAKSPREVFEFFNPELSRLHSPFLMRDMYVAVERIKKAVDSGEKVTIFTDSDLDGITGLSILHSLLKKIGLEASYRFPVGEESYGLSPDIVKEIADQGTDLLVTIDSAIKDIEEIKLARSLGMDVIVTDHHEPDEKLPAGLILNPKVNGCSFPFKYLAGAGVVFKLCHAILLSYLPSFTKTFLLVNKRDDLYSVSSVKDGILQNVETGISINEVNSLAQPGTIIITSFSDSESFSDIQRFDTEVTVYFLGEWLKGETTAGLQGAAEVLDIPHEIYSSEDELFYDIFRKIQLIQSPRVHDFLKEALGNVAIGTIADIMPLTDENRILTAHGILGLNKTTHPGLEALINNTKVNSKAIGWDIAPVLNTPGRYGEAELTAAFFLGESREELLEIVEKVKKMNQTRKELVQKICSDLISSIDRTEADGLDFLFLQKNEIPDGMAGLIANRLADYYGKPVIIATRNREGVKGSGRAPGKIDFLSFISRYEDEFIRIGGHAQAFGFTAEENRVDDIIARMRQDEFNFGEEDIPQYFDCVLPLKNVSLKLYTELETLGPFGKDNEEPLFGDADVKISSFSRFGKDKSHGKFIIDSHELIGWGKADEMEEWFTARKSASIIYSIEINDFRGRRNLRLILKDLVSHF